MELHLRIDRFVKDIWKNQIKDDYNNCVIWEESVLKSAFYYHLRERIGKDKTLMLYPEMRVKSPKGKSWRIDLAVVETEKCAIKKWEDCENRWKVRGSCIKRLIAAFEFKYWDGIYWGPLKIALKRLGKQFQEGVYYFDDNPNNPKNRKLLKAKLLYFCIVLDDKAINFSKIKEITKKLGSPKNLQLLIGGRELEFKLIKW